VKREQLLPSDVIKRNFPSNIIEEDKYLFNNEINKNFDKSYYYILNNTSITFFGYVFKNFKLITKFYFIKYDKISNIIKKIKIYFYFYFFKLFSMNKNVHKGIYIFDGNSNSYFHWLCDTLIKLEILEKEKLFNNYPIIIPSRFYNSNLKYILKIYKKKFIKINFFCRLFLRRLIIIDLLRPSGNYDPKTILGFREKLLLQSKKKNFSQYNGIYISRKKAKKRSEINFLEIEQILLKNKIYIFESEKYSLAEQISICSNFNFIIGVHGAGLSNMLWIKKKSSVLELRFEGDKYNNCYFSLANILKFNYNYLLCKKNEFKNFNNSNIKVDCNKLEKTIKHIINETNNSINDNT
tara:strand:- start:1070 stop:2125 length:1056 start_codon:yes stop_codon:yes gene_type:complete